MSGFFDLFTFGFIVFDSIDAAQAEADVQRDIGSKGVGELARLLSKSMRLLSKVADNNNVCYIFINQISLILENMGK